MTVYKTLAHEEKNGIAVSADECWDKFGTVPHYEVTVSHNSIAFLVIRAAKTTWRKRYKEAVQQYLR